MMMSATNKFALPHRPVPVDHGPRGQLHWSAGRLLVCLVFSCAQRPQCYLNTCAVSGLLSGRKQEWSRLDQDTADGEGK